MRLWLTQIIACYGKFVHPHKFICMHNLCYVHLFFFLSTSVRFFEGKFSNDFTLIKFIVYNSNNNTEMTETTLETERDGEMAVQYRNKAV